MCQEFHDSGGRFGADTSDERTRMLATLKWVPDDYGRFVERLRRYQTVYEEEEGFFPP